MRNMDGKRRYAELITESLGDRIELLESVAPNEVHLALRLESLGNLPELCSFFTETYKAQFTTLVANDERAFNGLFSLYYVFSIPSDDVFLVLRVPVDPRRPEAPRVLR